MVVVAKGRRGSDTACIVSLLEIILKVGREETISKNWFTHNVAIATFRSAEVAAIEVRLIEVNFDL